jgi:hypothetical protein
VPEFNFTNLVRRIQFVAILDLKDVIMRSVGNISLLLMLLILFLGVAHARNELVVIHVQVIDDDSGHSVPNKEVSLFRWKSYFFGIASKKYKIDHRLTDANGNASFSVDPNHSLELRLQRCPKDDHGMLYSLANRNFPSKENKLVMHYSFSKCLEAFGRND